MGRLPLLLSSAECLSPPGSPQYILQRHRFFSSLGIDDGYFQNTSVEEIVSHIVSLYGSKVQAYARADHKLKINLEKEGEKSAVSADQSGREGHPTDSDSMLVLL